MREEEIIIEYLRRAYHAVDGLWFMMVEEAGSFEETLELDRRVWEILAKLQARKARELVDCSGNTPAELVRCFALKLTADGHQFESFIEPAEVRFVVHQCPWLALLRKSDRQHLALQVAQTICPTEGRTWCAEFGDEYEFSMPQMACAGAELCEMRFVRKTEE